MGCAEQPCQQNRQWNRKKSARPFERRFCELGRNYLLYNLTEAQGQRSTTENLYRDWMGTDWEMDGEGQLEEHVRLVLEAHNILAVCGQCASWRIYQFIFVCERLKMDYDCTHLFVEGSF